MVEIYVDADACSVKDETVQVAARHSLKTYLVSDGGIRPRQNTLVELVIVDQGPDATDDWIADHIQKADICVTNDIPLAARCLERGAMTTGRQRHRRSRHTASIHPPCSRRYGQIDARQASGTD